MHNWLEFIISMKIKIFLLTIENLNLHIEMLSYKHLSNEIKMNIETAAKLRVRFKVL